MCMNKTPRGLPLCLADGENYLFPPVLLGPKGDPVRAKLRAFGEVVAEMMGVMPNEAEMKDGSPETRLKAFRAMAEQTTAVDEKRRLAFFDLMTVALEENYPERGADIAGLITPELLNPAVTIIKTGQYPEDFSPPPRAQGTGSGK